MSPEKIAAELRADLMAGRLWPGTELQQAGLAERFAVSRIPIRDALRILAAEGLVVIEPNRGATVIALSASEIGELYDLRLLLEGDCLRRAAVAMTPAAIEEIDRIRRKADLDAATPTWDEGDRAFHEALYAPAARPRQVALILSLRQTCRLFAASYATLPTERSRWLGDHELIVGRLRAGDTEGAVAALSRHIEGARDHLLALMARDRGQ